MYKLTSKHKEFFSFVLDAIMANPFSLDRDIAEKNILGMTPRRNDISEIMKKVDLALKSLEKNGKISISSYPKEEQRLIKGGLLFNLFHQFMDDFDKFISKQYQTSQSEIFPQGKEIYNLLINYGLLHEESIKMIGLFYQLRRTHYLVNRNIVGQSDSMTKLRCQLWSNIFTHKLNWYLDYLFEKMEDFSTLLLGETGVGKTSVARIVGCSGYIPFDLNEGKFKESFINIFSSVNLSQFPPGLIEGELFGYSKGSFTGAVKDYQGIFERANRFGAVFIDELGDVSSSLQVKLLNVLQERAFTSVGNSEIKRFSGRVIAATNQNIHDLVAKKVFREDLYYRLCSDIIVIPPLRTRIKENEDELFLILSNLMRKVVPHVDDQLIQMTHEVIKKNVGEDYSWPGNIRELEQCVRSICLSGKYQAWKSHKKDLDHIFEQEISAKSLLHNYTHHLYKKYGSYEKISKILQVDPRTVKSYMDEN